MRINLEEIGQIEDSQRMKFPSVGARLDFSLFMDVQCLTFLEMSIQAQW